MLSTPSCVILVPATHISINRRFAAALHEIEVLAVVEEHLGHDVGGSRIDLLLEVLEMNWI